MEAGQRELHRPRTASRLRLSFEDLDLHSGLGQHDCGRQPVWPCSNHDCA
jgi:hypothetical protein